MDTRENHLGLGARRLMDAFPAAVFVVDADVRVLEMNRAAQQYLASPETTLGFRLCGDVLRCVNTLKCDAECGHTDACDDCAVRQSVRAARAGEPVVRRWTEMRLVGGEGERRVNLLVSVSSLDGDETSGGEAQAGRGAGSAGNGDGGPLFLLVLEDVTEIVQLRRLLPVCAGCGKIRSEEQYWQNVHDYLREHTAVEFTHGLCPSCMVDLYGETGRAVMESLDAAPGASPTDDQRDESDPLSR